MKIYKITNKINGLAYIGQTKHSLQRRFNAHCNPKNNCSKLIRAIQKYGKNNFTIDLLFTSEDQTVIDLKEKEYIQQYNCIKNGYNILSGGRGFVQFKSRKGNKSHFKGKRHSEETKQKMRGMHKGVRRNTKTEFKGNAVIDLESGIVFDSVLEVAKCFNLKPHFLYEALKNPVINTTKFKYVEVGV